MSRKIKINQPCFKWPDRWSLLRPHREQLRAWQHPARFKTIHAGRRSGKTELFGKRRPVLWLLDQLKNPPPWDDPRRFIAAPTRQQVKDIYWRDIQSLIPREWIQSVSHSELSITTLWGAELRLVGLDAPQRIEGIAWDGGLVDEYANTKGGIWDANIRPAIADRNGNVDLIGVPDFIGPAQNEFREMCERGAKGDNPEWADFAWGSGDILPASELNSMRETMDPRLFTQETTGAFIVPGGLAFPDFSRERHVSRVRYNPGLPLRVALDFNVDPMSIVYIQHTECGDVAVTAEDQLPDTVSRMAAQAFVVRANREGWKLDQVFVYGDPAGKQRSTAADRIEQTSWTMFYNALTENAVRFTRMVRAAAIPVPATVNSVNSLLLNAEGRARLTIDPSCRALIKGLESALAQSDMEEFHALAAFRYYAEREFPIRAQGISHRFTVAVA